MAEQIRIVEEEQAQGTVLSIYNDVRRTMGVPVVGDLFRVFAAFPPFLELVWWEIKPLFGTMAFEGLADRIRAHAVACARQHLYVPDHTSILQTRGPDDAEIAHIRNVVEVFYETDPRLLVIATALQQSLIGGPVGSVTRRQVARRPAVSPFTMPLKLVSLTAPPERVRQVFDEVKLFLGLPFVVTDFRGLAQWPDYLQLAWNDVRGQVRTAEFRRHTKEIHDIAFSGLHELPQVVRVDDSTVRGAGIRADQLLQIHDMVRLFSQFLPSLIETISLLRLGLNSVLEHELLELEAGA